MSRYEEGLKVLEESCGNGKDNVIALCTLEEGEEGKIRPCVRDVDAYYEEGVFYITTWVESRKMRQIGANKEVAFSVSFEGISGNAIGENLGWVLDPKNAEIRDKLRETFKAWYDIANNEQDQRCVILALRMTQVNILKDHGAVHYTMDFVNHIELED